MTNLRPDLDRIKHEVQSCFERLIPAEALLLSGDYPSLMDFLARERQVIKQKGLWGLSLSKELGGHGLRLDEFAEIASIMGQSPLTHYVFGCQAPEAGNIEVLHHFATPEQKKTILAPLLEGKLRSCFAMTERLTSGANPTLLATRAYDEGDSWRLEGEKWFTTAADGASFVIVMAVSDPEAPPHQRASLFAFPLATPGLSVVRNISVMGHAGHGPFSHSELRFEQCRIPKDALLGKRGEGFRMAQARLGHGRIHHCARWIGIAQRCLDMLCQRAQQRSIGSDRTLSESDIIRSWIGEIASELAAARLFVKETARRIEDEGSAAARTEIAMIKYYVAGILQRAIDKSLQAHGAAGVSDDLILSFFYREERAARIYDGPDEVHKLSVARQLLKESSHVVR